MRNLPDAFHASPHFAQLALQGNWEQAMPFSTASLPSADQLAAFLSGTSEVAFEFFFGEKGAFFGVRYSGTPDEVANFVTQCCSLFGRELPGPRFFDALERVIGGRPGAEAPSFAELGAINAWKSVGAIRFENLAALLEHPTAALAPFRHTPLLGDEKHPKALEVAFANPLPHWFGFPVSEDKPPFALSETLLAATLGEIRQCFPPANLS